MDTACAAPQANPNAPVDTPREVERLRTPEPAVDPELTTQVQALLAEATSRGSWTSEDRDTLREELRGASDADRFASYQTIGKAINSGALRVSVEGAPF